MRIGVVVNAFPVPSETFIARQASALVARGHEVEILARRPGEPGHRPAVAHASHLLERTFIVPPCRPGGRVLRGAQGVLAAWRRGSPPHVAVDAVRRTSSEVLALAELIASRPRYDVLHCHFGPNGLLAVLARRLGATAARIATTYHGIDLTRVIRERGAAWYEPLLAEGDLHLPVSARFGRILAEAGAVPERVAVHHLGVPLADFPFRVRQAPDDGTTRAITVARLVEKKGVADGIRAVAALRRAGRRIAYDVLGDGPLRDELARLAAELDGGDGVRMRGWCDEAAVRRAMDAAHVMLAPSVRAADGDEEGIPVVLMEAMASGLPVVATRHSGIPELVADGVSGALVPEGDCDALAQALAHVADAPESWAAFGRAGRSRVEQAFDASRQDDLLDARLRELTAG